MHRKLEKIFYEARAPRLKWDDIGGFAEVKELVKEMVSLPLKQPELMEKIGLERPAGVMLWGPLGVGITMLAEAAATEAGASFVYVSGQEMLGKPDQIQNAFHDAVHEAPCVLFISDCEWLCPRVGCSYEWGPANFRGIPPTFATRELSELFIREIDAIQKHKNVMLVGSCYRIDTVDQAIIKEKKRFNRKIFVHPPRAVDREGMIDIYLKKMPRVDPSVNAKDLSLRTEGYVGWDAESLVKRAALEAVKAGRDMIMPEDFESSLRQVTPWLTPDMTAKYHEIDRNDCPHHYAF
jgi:transitional endoplasmic reticulum ATPase